MHLSQHRFERPGEGKEPGVLRLLRWTLVFAALPAFVAAGCRGGGDDARSRPGRILFLSDRDGDWALYSMDARGGDQRRAFPAGRVLPSGEALGYGEPL